MADTFTADALLKVASDADNRYGRIIILINIAI